MTILSEKYLYFPGAARNLGAKKARGEYLLFMDDDNYAKPYEISTFVQVARHSGIQLLSSFVDYFSGYSPPEVSVSVIISIYRIYICSETSCQRNSELFISWQCD